MVVRFARFISESSEFSLDSPEMAKGTILVDLVNHTDLVNFIQIIRFNFIALYLQPTMSNLSLPYEIRITKAIEAY